MCRLFEERLGVHDRLFLLREPEVEDVLKNSQIMTPRNIGPINLNFENGAVKNYRNT